MQDRGVQQKKRMDDYLKNETERDCLDGEVQQHVVALLVGEVGNVLGVGQGAGNILGGLNTTKLNQTSSSLLQ